MQIIIMSVPLFNIKYLYVYVYVLHLPIISLLLLLHRLRFVNIYKPISRLIPTNETVNFAQLTTYLLHHVDATIAYFLYT